MGYENRITEFERRLAPALGGKRSQRIATFSLPPYVGYREPSRSKVEGSIRWFYYYNLRRDVERAAAQLLLDLLRERGASRLRKVGARFLLALSRADGQARVSRHRGEYERRGVSEGVLALLLVAPARCRLRRRLRLRLGLLLLPLLALLVVLRDALLLDSLEQPLIDLCDTG